MSNIYKGELQDNNANTIYPHTEADIVFCADGEPVQNKLTKYEDSLGTVTGKTDSLEVGDSNILATSKAVNQLYKKLINMFKLDYENAISPTSDVIYGNYTFTAPKNGIFYATVVQSSRQAVGTLINGISVGQISLTGMSSGNPEIVPLTYFLSAGDVITISGNSGSCVQPATTRFIPFVEG